MFNIYKSNKMENLMDALVSVIGIPLDDPIKPEWIGIQSRGMKQWIDTSLAQNSGICTNIRYLFPKEIIEKLFFFQNQSLSAQNEFNETIIRYKIIDILSNPELGLEFKEIKNFLEDDNDGTKLFGLCDKLSNIFDNYQVYRPEMLLDWYKDDHSKHNGFSKNGPTSLWQPVLLRNLVENDLNKAIFFQSDSFLKDLATCPLQTNGIFSRVSLFGISSLPRMFMEIFSAVSSYIDIHLFLLTPTKEFFGYILSEKEQARISSIEKDKSYEDEALYYELGNPLLASLGKTGREFHLFLESLSYHEPLENLWSDPLKTSENMLSIIQSDILNLYHRKDKGDHEPVTILSDDFSVSIHSCHTPMREAQVLKDWLLFLFDKNPELKPHDIIVMMPQIESYAPYISSVFGMENKIPFTISDRTKKTEYEIVEAFLKILDQKENRFELHTILDLLSCSCIADRFKISNDDIKTLERFSKKAGILWGMDSDHRKAIGMPEINENTFKHGLQRLMLGYAMPQANDVLIKNSVASPSLEGTEAEILGKFALFCDVLFSSLNKIEGEKSIEKWLDTFQGLINNMIDRSSQYEDQYLFLIQTLKKIFSDTKIARFKRKISFNAMYKILEKELSISLSQGSFMSGRVTFCNIMPMRSIPFKVVALMGMQESSFPRHSYNESFNLIKKYPRPGDKNERDEDRYLFLESLLSARENLIVTYTGMDIKDNSSIPASSVVNELIDTINESFIFDEKDTFYFKHPLHAFSEKYFLRKDNNPFFSFSKNNFEIFKALQQDRSKEDNKPISFEGSKKEDANKIISIEELVTFFQMPIEYYMKKSLHLFFSKPLEQIDDREPDVLEGLLFYETGNLLIDKSIKKGALFDFYSTLKAMGKLPYQNKGMLEYSRLQKIVDPLILKAKDYLDKRKMSPIELDIDIEGINLTGSVNNLIEDHRFTMTFGKLNPKRLLREWIFFLALRCTDNDKNIKNSVIIGRNPKDGTKISKIEFKESGQKSYEILNFLIKEYQKGILEPYLFFPETSWHFANEFLKTDQSYNIENVLKSQNKAKGYWYNSFSNQGEKINRYAALFFEKKDLFDETQYLIESGFAKNSVNVFKPLIENML